MSESAPNKNVEFLPPNLPTPKNILSQVDSKIYKQLFIFLGVALIIAIALYIYIRIGQEMVVKEQTKETVNQTQVVDKKAEETKAKFSIDQQRKNDVVIINSALKSYFVTNKKPPQSLDELVPGSLPQLPTDPETKGNYSYTPTENPDGWKVSATLSDGKVFEVNGP